MAYEHQPELPTAPRFSLKRMFLASTLVAVGVGAAGVIDAIPIQQLYRVVAVTIFLLPGTLIGTGLFALFGRLWVGALISVTLQVLFIAYVHFLC